MRYAIWGANLGISGIFLIIALAAVFAGAESALPFNIDTVDLLVGLIALDFVKDAVSSGIGFMGL